jgi:hypothetical protein
MSPMPASRNSSRDAIQGSVVAKLAGQKTSKAGEPGAVRAAQPLVPAGDQGVYRSSGHVDRASPESLRRVDDEQHARLPARRAQLVQVKRPPGERVHPGDGQQPGTRPDGRGDFGGGQPIPGRAQRADPHALRGQPLPRQDGGRVVPLDDQDLVAVLPGQAVGHQVQPVRGAVAQYDLVRRAADQPGQQRPQPLGHVAEVVVADPVRGRLQRGRLPGHLDRRPRQRPLVGGVQPDPPVERTELRRGRGCLRHDRLTTASPVG